MTEEAFVIFVPSLGFQKHSIHLSVKGRVLSISGLAVTPQGPRVLKGDAEVPEAIFFYAKNVVAAMEDGYLQVRFPFGSKETMIEESFPVVWGTESAKEKAAGIWLYDLGMNTFNMFGLQFRLGKIISGANLEGIVSYALYIMASCKTKGVIKGEGKQKQQDAINDMSKDAIV